MPESISSSDVVSRSRPVLFNIGEFDAAIEDHGVTLVHWRAMRCPVGLVRRYDNRRPDHDHVGCSNGFVYTLAGRIKGLFTGNSVDQSLRDIGWVEGSTVQITLQRAYEDDNGVPNDNDVQVAPFDRLYLEDANVTVPTWQLFEASLTGREKLQYPIVAVQDLMDSEGRRYKQGVDFDVKGGYLVWTGSRPTYNQEEGQGQVCSVRYTYRPYYYCKRLMHEIRISPILGEDGNVTMERMPVAMLIQREHVYEKQDNDPEAPASTAQAPAPADGSFGPR